MEAQTKTPADSFFKKYLFQLMCGWVSPSVLVIAKTGLLNTW